MDIGIGLPNAVRGVDRAGIVDWARRAEEAGRAVKGVSKSGGASGTYEAE